MNRTMNCQMYELNFDVRIDVFAFACLIMNVHTCYNIINSASFAFGIHTCNNGSRILSFSKRQRVQIWLEKPMEKQTRYFDFYYSCKLNNLSGHRSNQELNFLCWIRSCLAIDSSMKNFWSQGMFLTFSSPEMRFLVDSSSCSNKMSYKHQSRTFMG